ncbi:MAG: NAD(P)H-binding protein [Chloroflexi bacterium]|nr:NAD(P)H-binding protein [Chloroflexota bacterium]MDA1148044.1 NAD(P)H-binding protein [Chloroflexota bacterium]
MSTDRDELHVIFGAGPVGLTVAEELRARGKRVRLVNRSGRSAGAPDGADVEWVSADAMDPALAISAADGATVVYFALNPEYHQWRQLFPPMQANVLEAAKRAGARLVAMENVYMYGPTGGVPMTESLPQSATTKKGRIRAAMHDDLMAAHARGDVAVAVARAADFVGPRVTSSALGDRVVPALLAGKKAQVVGNIDLPHTYTYMPDVGRALVTLGERDEALGEVWHVPSGGTVTTREYLRLLASAAGTGEPKIQVAPKLLLRALGLTNPQVRELIEMLHEFEEPFILDHSKYVAAFGDPSTPLEAAATATVEWYRARAS